MTTLTLTPPAPFMNANDRLHYRVKAKLTKAWRMAACEAATSVVPAPVFDGRVRIVCSVRLADNRRRECSNLQPTFKAIVDGIVDAGWLEDDSDDHVVGPDARRIRPNGTPIVRIDVRAIT